MYTPRIVMTYSEPEYCIWFVPSDPFAPCKLVGTFSDFIEAVWFRDNVNLNLEYRNAY